MGYFGLKQYLYMAAKLALLHQGSIAAEFHLLPPLDSGSHSCCSSSFCQFKQSRTAPCHELCCPPRLLALCSASLLPGLQFCAWLPQPARMLHRSRPPSFMVCFSHVHLGQGPACCPPAPPWLCSCCTRRRSCFLTPVTSCLLSCS